MTIPSLSCMCLLLACLPFYATGAENLLPNADFAQWEEGKPAGWDLGNKWKPEYVSKVSEDGRTFVRIAMPAEEAGTQNVHVKIPVVPGQEYEMGVEMRASNLITGEKNWQTARMAMSWENEIGRRVGGWPKCPELDQDSGWKTITVKNTAPEGAAYLNLALGIYKASGTVDFHQPRMEPVGEAPAAAKAVNTIAEEPVTAFAADGKIPGSRPVIPYEGFQPGMIKGASNQPAVGKPLVRHVCTVRPDILSLTIDSQYADKLAFRPYKPHHADKVELTGYPVDMRLAEISGVAPYVTDEHRNKGQARLFRLVKQGNDNVGFLVGPDADLLAPFDRMKGDDLQLNRFTKPNNFRVTSPDDPDFSGKGVQPTAVHVKSQPHSHARTDAYRKEFGKRHEVFLELPKPLKPGKTYEVTFNDEAVEGPISFTFDDRRLRTEAIHVNLGGYHLNQATKRAFLSQWMGTGGGVDYEEGMAYQIVEDDNGKVVAEGETILLTKASDIPNGDDENMTRTDVYAIDLGGISEPGTYRIVVPGIGTSFPFRVDENVWRDVLRLQMTGVFNQRSGLALGPPYTTYTRPRDFHPEDGKTIHLTDPDKFFESQSKQGGGRNLFGNIQDSLIIDSSHPGAWGGWHDAADFDRSILPQGHLTSVQRLLDLYEANPEYFETIEFNIPESGNHIPDVIDEALWCMDLFRRVQQEDGGIPSSIESIEHPRSGETSWIDSLPAALTPPTPQTCYVYAATAAKTARLLEKYDPKRAADFRDSALRAMEWAENNPDVPNIYSTGQPWKERPNESLNMAAAELLRLTNDPKWDEVFIETVNRDDAGNPVFKHGNWLRELDGYAPYVLYDGPNADKALQQQLRNLIVERADSWLETAQETPYPAIRPKGFGISWALVPAWRPELTVYAHRLTGDPKYIDALEQSSLYSMGANPKNLSLTSGLGPRSLVPYHKYDQAGLDIPSGINTYGPANEGKARRYLDRLNPHLEPDYGDWPTAEQYFYVSIPPLNEYTINSMTRQLIVWGHIAATYGDK